MPRRSSVRSLWSAKSLAPVSNQAMPTGSKSVSPEAASSSSQRSSDRCALSVYHS